MPANDQKTVHLKFSEDELNEIDAWKDARHIRTRSEGIRQLIRIALSDSGASGGLQESGMSFRSPKPPMPAGTNQAIEEFIREAVQKEVEKELSKYKKS